MHASGITPAWEPDSPATRRYALRRMQRLSARLADAYGTPELGNLPDPLDEAIYILLTLQTDIPRARAVWAALRERYSGGWAQLASSPPGELEEALRPAGFQNARAKILRSLVAAIQARFGAVSLDPLRELSTVEAEAVLRSLPGLDQKSARCVLLYSLGRDVFPVDVNAFRFFQRYGVVTPSARYRRRPLHDALQELVPLRERHPLHVNLVIHGQRTCRPLAPQCSGCPVRRGCRTGAATTARATRANARG